MVAVSVIGGAGKGYHPPPRAASRPPCAARESGLERRPGHTPASKASRAAGSVTEALQAKSLHT